MRKAMSLLCLLVCPFVLACGGDDGSNPFAGTGTVSADGGSTQGDASATGVSMTGSSGTTMGSAENSTAANDSTGDPIFDVGGGNEETGTVPDTCVNVDVLYIIDNSPSMYDEQQTLIANFGAFVSDMQDALVDVDSYHIGVLTTDDFETSGIFDDGDDSVNESYPECQGLGGLVVEAQAGSCLPFADGNNFITEGDDLETKFSCVANVGENGDSDEKVGDALISLLNSQVGANDVSACNSGFLRDDALLIIVILTDENDSSNTGPGQWFQAVVDAKGVEENAVVLSLTWDSSFPGCSEDLSETDGYTLVEFTEMFTNHSVGNICENSYAGFFGATLPVIEGACDEFVPAG